MRDDRPEVFNDFGIGEDIINHFNDIIIKRMEGDERLQIWILVTMDGVSTQMYRYFDEIGWRANGEWIKIHKSKIQVEYSRYEIEDSIY